MQKRCIIFGNRQVSVYLITVLVVRKKILVRNFVCKAPQSSNIPIKALKSVHENFHPKNATSKDTRYNNSNNSCANCQPPETQQSSGHASLYQKFALPKAACQLSGSSLNRVQSWLFWLQLTAASVNCASIVIHMPCVKPCYHGTRSISC